MAAPLEVVVARRLIEQNWPAPQTEQVSILDSVGRILAEDVRAATDSPPYDKSMMDGYAVLSSDLPSGSARLRVDGEVLAGCQADRPLAAGTAIRIMTGAPLPEGADAVVIVEHTRLSDEDGIVEIVTPGVAIGQHILRQAAVVGRNDLILPRGHRVRAVDVGMLAEAGRTQVLSWARRRVALFQTGDEVVAPGEPLGPAQIRNSNGPLLAALLHQWNAEVLDLGIVPDDEVALRAAVEQGMNADLLVMTGGVSQGVRDLVPQVMREAGVGEVFHRVAMKPGKPFWFGSYVRDARSTLVFGLPGNPVSGLVAGLLFVAPTLAHLHGDLDPWTRGWKSGLLTESFRANPRLTVYWPAEVVAPKQPGEPIASKAGQLIDDYETSAIRLRPLPWKGSADLFTLGRAQGLIEFPASEEAWQQDQIVRWLPLF